jgi:hypothetical protein
MSIKSAPLTVVLDDFSSAGKVAWEGSLQRGAGTFPDKRPSSAVIGVLTTKRLPADWRGHGSIQFTVHNPNNKVVLGGISLYDQQALVSPELEFGDCVTRGGAVMLCEGVNHIVLQIDPLQTQQGTRMLDISKIAEVKLHIPELKGGQPLSVANLRLSADTNAVDKLGDVKPGDTVTTLKHLDISTYTFEPEKFQDSAEVNELKKQVEDEVERLKRAIELAKLNGKQTWYDEAALVAADVAAGLRPRLAWHFSQTAKRENLSGALTLVKRHREFLEYKIIGRVHEDDEDDSNVALSNVKPVPNTGKLRIQGSKFVDEAGEPALLCALCYHHEGTLNKFFATNLHREEIFAVGGGSRYDIEWSPVYEAFHKYPGTKRVGWRGWCGHLIKDQWAMGGRKENVVICLENKHILEAIEKYNLEKSSIWKNRKELTYIILAYELMYICWCDDSIARFRTWLKERHGTVAKLNECWSAKHASFDEVSPPPAPSAGGASGAEAINRAAWFDWADWNTRRFTDHLKWSKASARKHHATIPICAGGTHSVLSPGNSVTGIDEEMIINEVDDVILHEGHDTLTIDLMRALAEKPKPMVDPEHGAKATRQLLQYLHGKSIVAKFWWPRQPSRQFPTSTLNASPPHGLDTIEMVYEYMRVALDARRLSAEITAFWDTPKELAIMFSKTNILQVTPALMGAQSTPFIKSLRAAYESARCLDIPITFVSEKQIAAGKAANYKLVVMAGMRHMPAKIFDGLDAYVRAGGTVLVTPEALIADEYNRPVDYLSRWGITVTGSEIPSIQGLGELEQGYDQNLSRGVKFGKGREITAKRVDPSLNMPAFKTAGIFLATESKGEVLAAGPADEPLLIKLAVGKGQVWFAAGEPDQATLHALVDHLADQTKIDRPLKVSGTDGRRILGLECRLARRTHDDLVYLANETDKDIQYSLETNRQITGIRELTTLKYQAKPAGTVPAGRTIMLSLAEDPVARVMRGIKGGAGANL